MAPTDTATETETEVDDSVAEETVVKEPITFSYFTGNGLGATSVEKLSDSKIGKMINEATGVDIEFEYVVGDVAQKVGVMTAGGDYPDLIMGGGAVADEFVNAKALIPLNDYIDNYPNLKKVYEKYYNSMKEAADGNIYYLPMGPLIGDTKPVTTMSGYYAFSIQKRVLKELNYPKMTTVQDFFNAIKAYKEKYPLTDGKETLGFEILNHEWRDNFTWAYEVASGYVNNIGYDAWCLVDYEKKAFAGLKNSSDGYYKMGKIINQAFDDGLISEESLIQTYDQYVAKLASGRVLATMDADWDYGSAQAALRQEGKEDSTYVQFSLTFDEGVEKLPQVFSYPASEGLGISVKAENVERILEFLDYMASEEVQKLRRWGIEGEDYTVNADGTFTRTEEQQIRATGNPEYQKSQGINSIVHGFPYSEGIWEDGNTCDPSQQTDIALISFTDDEKEIYAKYGWTLPSDQLNLQVVDAKWSPTWSINLGDGTPAKAYQLAQNELDVKWRTRLITSSPAEYDAVWNNYQEELKKLDPQPFIDAINKEFQYRESTR